MAIRPGPDSLPAERAALIILDGWGLAEPGPGNAVAAARTPVFDELWEGVPDDHADRLRARGRACPRARWATPRSGI